MAGIGTGTEYSVRHRTNFVGLHREEIPRRQTSAKAGSSFSPSGLILLARPALRSCRLGRGPWRSSRFCRRPDHLFLNLPIFRSFACWLHDVLPTPHGRSTSPRERTTRMSVASRSPRGAARPIFDSRATNFAGGIRCLPGRDRKDQRVMEEASSGPREYVIKRRRRQDRP